MLLNKKPCSEFTLLYRFFGVPIAIGTTCLEAVIPIFLREDTHIKLKLCKVN